MNPAPPSSCQFIEKQFTQKNILSPISNANLLKKALINQNILNNLIKQKLEQNVKKDIQTQSDK